MTGDLESKSDSSCKTSRRAGPDMALPFVFGFQLLAPPNLCFKKTQGDRKRPFAGPA